MGVEMLLGLPTLDVSSRHRNVLVLSVMLHTHFLLS